MLCQIMEHTILIKIKDAIQSLSVPRTSLIILLVIYFYGCTAPTDEKTFLEQRSPGKQPPRVQPNLVCSKSPTLNIQRARNGRQPIALSIY